MGKPGKEDNWKKEEDREGMKGDDDEGIGTPTIQKSLSKFIIVS